MSIEPQPCYICPSCGVPFSEHKGLIETCRELQDAKEEIERLDMDLSLLSQQMVYRGNSVGWWHSKATKYKQALSDVWDSLHAAGIKSDGETHCADAILILKAERDRYREALQRIKKMETHICGDLKLIASNALRGEK